MSVRHDKVMSIFSEKSASWNRKAGCIRTVLGEPERLAKLLPEYIRDGMLVLDVGTGTGKIALKLHEVNNSVKILSIDLSFNMLKAASALTAPADINLVQGDAENMPFRSHLFDVVSAQQVLHHLDHPIKFVTETERVLKPDGVLLLLAVGPHYQQSLFPYIGAPIDEDPLGRVDEDALVSWMKRAGMEIQTMIHDRIQFVFVSFEDYFVFMDAIGALNRPFGYNEVSESTKRRFLYSHCRSAIRSDGALVVDGEYITLVAQRCGRISWTV